MARRRRRKRSGAAAGNLDSLLDTLTSVVGILIIILIVIQLGVKEKVKELVLEIETRDISQKEVDSKAAELEEMKELIKKREEDFLSKNKTYKTQMVQLKALQKQEKDASSKLTAVKSMKADPARQKSIGTGLTSENFLRLAVSRKS